jgi:TatD DNase family protein
MIDTHVHLNDDDLYADLPQILERANANGVGTFVVVSYDTPSSERALKLAAEDPRIHAVVGIHPSNALQWSETSAEQLRQWAAKPGVVGIGEIGLDYYHETASPEIQKKAFREQLSIARSLELPVVIHCRDAYNDTLDILEAEAGNLTVILHCFLGEMQHAERAFARGWYIGVDGPVTYKKSDDLRAIIRAAPQSLLLLETDAPYLSPEPFRGKFPNEPARLPYIAAKIAKTRNETPDQVAEYTTTNARKAFRLQV